VDGAAERLARILGQARRRRKRVLLLGIGNELRGDDAVGHLIAQDLSRHSRGPFLSVSAGVALENASYLVRRHAADLLFLVDAADAGNLAPGEWDFFDPDCLDTFCHSTHSLPLSLLVSVWRSETPGLRVHFLGFGVHPPRDFAPLSPEVEAARHQVTAIFARHLHLRGGETAKGEGAATRRPLH